MTAANTNLTIGTFDLKGDVMFEVKLGGNSNIDTINNAADRLSLTTNGNSSLTIQTLNQNRADSQLVIQEAPGSIVINTLNQSGGSVYQRTEEVKVANITGGYDTTKAMDLLAVALVHQVMAVESPHSISKAEILLNMLGKSLLLTSPVEFSPIKVAHLAMSCLKLVAVALHLSMAQILPLLTSPKRVAITLSSVRLLNLL